MSATFDKTESLCPEVSRDAVEVQIHDPLTTWYCVDDDNPKWKFNEAEDLRVETTDQWTRGMFVTNQNTRDQKNDHSDSEAPGGTDWMTEGNGNRINRCVRSPGHDIFGRLLLKRIFGA